MLGALEDGGAPDHCGKDPPPPVPPTPAVTSKPIPARWLSTIPAVRVSAKPSSGFA